MSQEDGQPPRLSTSEEYLLIRETCLQMAGPLGYIGLLTLTTKRLTFEPKGKVDKLIGAQINTLDLVDIRKAKFGGLKQCLTLYKRKRKVRFSGSGAKRVWFRLSALLHDMGIEGGEEGRFEPDERVLASGTMQLMIAGLLGSEGEATLTDRRFHFVPGRGPERFLWPGRVKEIDVNLKKIHDVQLTSLGRRLHLTIEGERYQFIGSSVPRFYNSLSSLGPLGATLSERSQVLGTWEGTRFIGPLGCAGQIVVTARSLHYQPAGRLDVAFGVAGVEVPFDEVQEMRCVGWPDKRLQLTLASGTIAFGVEDLTERFMDLAPLIMDTVESRFMELARMHEYKSEHVDEVVGARVDAFQLPWGEKVLAMSPATFWHDTYHLERGWLILTDQQLVFLPFNLDAEVAVFALDLTLPPAVDEFAPGEVLFELAGTVYRFVPLIGERFTAKFWTLMDRGSADNAWRRKWGDHFKHLIGDVPSIELLSEGQVVAKLKPAVTVAHTYGFGVVFPGPPGPALAPGADIELVVNSGRGRFQFRGHIVKHESYAVGGSKDGEIQLLVVAHTPLLSVANRRQYFRVASVEKVAIMPLDDAVMPRGHKRKRPLICTFDNLSVGGCAFFADRDLLRGSRLHVLLPTPHLKLRVTAEVMASRRAPEGPQPWHHRVNFLHRSAKQAEAVGDLVMQLQRDRLLSEGNTIETADEEGLRFRALADSDAAMRVLDPSAVVPPPKRP